MHKKLLFTAFCLMMLLVLSGCRQRIMPNADQVIYETYLQQEATQETTEPSTEPSSEPSTEPTTEPSTQPTEDSQELSTEQEASSSAPPVEETTAVNGGEATVPETTEPPAEAEKITLTLNAGHGECPTQSLTLTVGAPYGDLPAATREGYTFTGWYDRQNGGRHIDASTLVTRAEDHTLFAHWAARAGFALTFDSVGGRLASDQVERLVYHGDAYGELPVPTRRGYDFIGWFTASEGGVQIQPSDTFTGTENQTLYAQWSYNPFDYWSFLLENTTQQVYACQQASVYWEFEADHVTVGWCNMISATGSFNVAQNLSDFNVTDEWVLGKNPNVIVKCIDNMGAASAYYQAMTARFPGYRVLIVPSAGIYGSASEVLYYNLCFGKLLYPDWYADVDLNTVAAELGVSGSIYG